MDKETALIKLGLRIRNIRKDKGLTQVQLAYAIGKDQQAIQRIEAGISNPTYVSLMQIAEGLHVSLEEIVKDL